MKIDKEYKECLLFSLRLKKYLDEGDTKVLEKAKQLGEAIEGDVEYQLIKKTIIKTLNDLSDYNKFKHRDLLYETLRALNFSDSEITIDKMRLRATKKREDTKELVQEILRKDYGERVDEKELFALYSYLVQKAIMSQDNDLIQESIKAIEKIEERGLKNG